VGDSSAEGGDVVAEVRMEDGVVEGGDVYYEVCYLELKGRSPCYAKIVVGSEDVVLVRVDEGSVSIAKARGNPKRRVVSGGLNVLFLVVVQVAVRVERSTTGVWSEGGEVLVFARNRSTARTKR